MSLTQLRSESTLPKSESMSIRHFIKALCDVDSGMNRSFPSCLSYSSNIFTELPEKVMPLPHFLLYTRVSWLKDGYDTLSRLLIQLIEYISYHKNIDTHSQTKGVTLQ